MDSSSLVGELSLCVAVTGAGGELETEGDYKIKPVCVGFQMFC